MKVFPLALALTLVACASAGTNYDPAAISQLTPGQTESQVIAALGKPNSLAVRADGTRVLGWTYGSSDMLGRVQGRAVFILFDQNGHLLRIAGQSDMSNKGI